MMRTYWTSDKGGTNDGCSADKVLDNAYAQGLMEDTIVVFTGGVIHMIPVKNIRILWRIRCSQISGRITICWNLRIINNLMPYMEEKLFAPL